MDNNEVLEHLLKIESEAAALVDNAQAEADKRVAEADRQNRAIYDERYRAGSERLESEFLKTKDQIQQQYGEELNAYIQKISSVKVDADRFSGLLDRLIAEEG